MNKIGKICELLRCYQYVLIWLPINCFKTNKKSLTSCKCFSSPALGDLYQILTLVKCSDTLYPLGNPFFGGKNIRSRKLQVQKTKFKKFKWWCIILFQCPYRANRFFKEYGICVYIDHKTCKKIQFDIVKCMYAHKHIMFLL